MSLSKLLEQGGYAHVPLTKNGVGHFQTPGWLNGHPLSVLLDTGASQTVISLELAKALELEIEKLPMQGGGAGGAAIELFLIPTARLSLGGIQAQHKEIVAMDLWHVNESLRLKGADPVDAILGVDVFEAQAAVIDYGSSSLYLKIRS